MGEYELSGAGGNIQTQTQTHKDSAWPKGRAKEKTFKLDVVCFVDKRPSTY